MKIKKILFNCGLNERQALVYLACLEIGSSPVQKIASKAGLARSTVYEVLRILEQQGFVSTFLKKKVKYFSAADPSQIVRLAQSKADALKSALPELNALAGQTRRRPTVRFYQGKEEMKIIFEEMLDEAKELASFGSAEDLFREMGDYFYNFVERRARKKIPVRVILKESAKARERQQLGQRELRQVKIISNEYKYNGNIFIWKNKIAMFSFIHDFVAVVVESQQLADIQTAMFNCLWNKI